MAGENHAATTAASEASCLLGLGWYLIPALLLPSLSRKKLAAPAQGTLYPSPGPMSDLGSEISS